MGELKRYRVTYSVDVYVEAHDEDEARALADKESLNTPDCDATCVEVVKV